MTYKDLFEVYQGKIAWADRMMKSFPSQEQEWRRVKFAVFLMFQELRMSCDDAPEFEDCVHYDPKFADKYPLQECFSEGSGEVYVFPVIGELTYRGLTLPIYVDDYGCQNFITIDGEDIPIETMGGIWDWYYPIDKHLDKID